jgi:hypothetical protein
MNLNKTKHAKKNHHVISQAWLKDLEQHHNGSDFRKLMQSLLDKLQYTPKLESQQTDLKENYQLLFERPLMRLQTQRLFQNYVQKNVDWKNARQEFHSIWSEQCVIDSNTLKQLDPNGLSPRFSNADTLRYRDYLIHMLFMMLCIQPNLNVPDYLVPFVVWMNGIEQAQTTAKVSLRLQPDIHSEIVYELPKHSLVNVYSDDNPLWKKVKFSNNDQEHHGYIMKAYLKF